MSWSPIPARGLVYGNRGCLHDASGRIRRRFPTRRWIACRLQFRGWQRGPLLQPGRFTELFFLDDATAMAAGHRACALCRREDYNRLLDVWRQLHPGQAGADAMDAQLDAERRDPGTRERRLHAMPAGSLPDGAFVLEDGGTAPGARRCAAALVVRRVRRSASAAGARPMQVITPPSLVELLRAGWDPLVPLLHPSAVA